MYEKEKSELAMLRWHSIYNPHYTQSHLLPKHPRYLVYVEEIKKKMGDIYNAIDININSVSKECSMNAAMF